MRNINMVKERIFQDTIVEMLEIASFNCIFNHIKYFFKKILKTCTSWNFFSNEI